MYLKDNGYLNTFRIIIDLKNLFVLHVDDSKYKHTCKSQWSIHRSEHFVEQVALKYTFYWFYGKLWSIELTKLLVKRDFLILVCRNPMLIKDFISFTNPPPPGGHFCHVNKILNQMNILTFKLHKNITANLSETNTQQKKKNRRKKKQIKKKSNK